MQKTSPARRRTLSIPRRGQSEGTGSAQLSDWALQQRPAGRSGRSVCRGAFRSGLALPPRRGGPAGRQARGADRKAGHRRNAARLDGPLGDFRSIPGRPGAGHDKGHGGRNRGAGHGDRARPGEWRAVDRHNRPIRATAPAGRERAQAYARTASDDQRRAGHAARGGFGRCCL